MNNQPHKSAAPPTSSAPPTLHTLYRQLVTAFRKAKIAAPELDARILVCHACGVSHENFAAEPGLTVGNAELQLARRFAERRCAREPVSRILGEREFWGLDFDISPDTLDPRPDTETLVAAAQDVTQELGGGDPLSILDIGTGSGCILVSLLLNRMTARGVGTDISEEALGVARTNAERHGVDARAQFMRAHWADGLAGQFDLVVANPPYIPAGEISNLEPEVHTYDPTRALDGGADGLDAYRAIVPRLGEILAHRGWVLLEVGAGQADAVSALLADQEGVLVFDEVRRWKDLGGRVRCVGARRSLTL